MAHQAGRIPWHLVARNLSFHTENLYHPGMKRAMSVTDIRPRFDADQEADFNEFVTAFKETLEEQIEIDLEKHGPLPQPCGSDAIVLDEEIVKKINPIMHHVCVANDQFGRTCTKALKDNPQTRYPGILRVSCEHIPGTSTLQQCGCLLNDADRRMRAFIRGFHDSDCFQFMKEQKEMFFAFETLKALLLSDEMDALLQICAHPNVDIMQWESLCECECGPSMLGWSVIIDATLASYFVLNILYCHPELWDSARGRTEKREYRSTAFYQKGLEDATYYQDIGSFVNAPHRVFFGVADDVWVKPYAGSYFSQYIMFGVRYGILPIQKFMRLDKRIYSQASMEYVQEVQSILTAKGLPLELAHEVIDCVDQGPFDDFRLYLAHDPLHPRNTEELSRYLEYCWKLLIRCGVMAGSQDHSIDWTGYMESCIRRSWPDAKFVSETSRRDL